MASSEGTKTNSGVLDYFDSQNTFEAEGAAERRGEGSCGVTGLSAFRTLSKLETACHQFCITKKQNKEMNNIMTNNNAIPYAFPSHHLNIILAEF